MEGLETIRNPQGEPTEVWVLSKRTGRRTTSGAAFHEDLPGQYVSTGRRAAQAVAALKKERAGHPGGGK